MMRQTHVIAFVVLSVFVVACSEEQAPFAPPAPVDATAIAARVRLALPHASEESRTQAQADTLAYEQGERAKRARSALDPATLRTLLAKLEANPSAEQTAAFDEQTRLFAEQARARGAENAALLETLPEGPERNAKVAELAAQTMHRERRLSDLQELTSRIQRSAALGDADALHTEAEQFLGLLSPAQASPLLHGTLTYVAPTPSTFEPQLQSSVAPAAGLSLPLSSSVPGGLGADALLDDTRLAEEVLVSDALKIESQRLGKSPAKIYDFVKNAITLEAAYGVRQDSNETLLNRRGSAWEIAALTIALFRAAEIPARFVTATIRVDVTRALELYHVTTEAELFDLLSQSGIPHRLTSSGPRALDFEHVFVEAFIAYSPNRGADIGTGAKAWHAFDPAIAGAIRERITAPASSAVTQFSPDVGSFLIGYRAGNAATDVVGAFNAHLTSFATPTGLAAQTRGTTFSAEHTGYLPNSFPYVLVATTGEFAFLPDRLKPHVTVGVAAANNRVYLAKAPLHRLTGHRVTLNYVPATETDAQLLAQAGGMSAAPLSLLKVKPQLRIDGVPIPVVTESLNREMTAHSFETGTLVPGMAAQVSVTAIQGAQQRTVSNLHTTGMPLVIDFGVPGSRRSVSEPMGDADLDNYLVRKLAGVTRAYLTGVGQAEQAISPLFNLTVAYPEPSIVVGRVEAKVTTLFGIPQSMTGSAISIDAPSRPVSLAGASADKVGFRRLINEQASVVERLALEDSLGVPATSATALLQRALAASREVVNLFGTEDANLQRLNHPAPVLADIADHLALGRQVVVPLDPFTIDDFTGAGYIVTQPNTGESSSILYGEVALSGGITVTAPSTWEPALAALMADPTSPEALPFDDISSLTEVSLQASLSTNQVGTVGSTHPSTLFVRAHRAGRPVSGVPVTFSLAIGDGAFYANRIVAPEFTGQDPGAYMGVIDAGPRTLTAVTDEFGVASVVFQNYPNVDRKFVAVPPEVCGQSGTYQQVAGFARVQFAAQRGNVSALGATQFDLLSCPRSAKYISRVFLPGYVVDRRAGFADNDPFDALVHDSFANRLANQVVTWSTTQDGGRFAPDGTNYVRTEAMPGATLSCTTATDGRCQVRYGQGHGSGNVIATVAGASPSITEIYGANYNCVLVTNLTPRPGSFFSGFGHGGTFGAFAGYSVSGVKYSRARAEDPYSVTSTPLTATITAWPSETTLSELSGSTITSRYLMDGGIQITAVYGWYDGRCSGEHRKVQSVWRASMSTARSDSSGQTHEVANGGVVLTTDRFVDLAVGHSADTAQFVAIDNPDGALNLSGVPLVMLDKPALMLPGTTQFDRGWYLGQRSNHHIYFLTETAQVGVVHFGFRSPPETTDLESTTIAVAQLEVSAVNYSPVLRDNRGLSTQPINARVVATFPAGYEPSDLVLSAKGVDSPTDGTQFTLPMRSGTIDWVIPVGTDLGTADDIVLSVRAFGANYDVESPRVLYQAAPIGDADSDDVGTDLDCDDSDPSVGIVGPDGLCNIAPKKAECELTEFNTATDDCEVDQGGPVRPLDGSMYYRPSADMTVATQSGIPFSFGRSYESRIARGDSGRVQNSILGRGWRASYESFVSIGLPTLDEVTGKLTNHINIHFDTGEIVTLNGPFTDSESAKQVFVDLSSGHTSSTYRASWDTISTLEVKSPSGRTLRFGGYFGAVALPGQRLNLTQIVNTDGRKIAVTLDSQHRFVNAVHEDGFFYRVSAKSQLPTANAIEIEYGRGTRVAGIVKYSRSSFEFTPARQEHLITGVTWDDGRTESLSYTRNDSLGVPFSLDAWSDGRGGVSQQPGKRRREPFILLERVEDSFGTLVEHHRYNLHGAIVATERPGEALRFSYSGTSGSSTTTVTNDTTGEVRTFGFSGADLITLSTTCATCSTVTQINRDADGRKNGYLDRRGTWKALELEPNTTRIVGETDNGTPGSSFAQGAVYRQVKHVYGNDFFSGSIAPTETRRPSVMGGEFTVTRTFTPKGPAGSLPEGLPLAVTARSSNEARSWRAEYDSFGRLVRRTGSRGETESFNYFNIGLDLSAGRLRDVTVTTGSGQSLTTRFDNYNIWGKPGRVTAPDGTVTTLVYTETGALKSSTTDDLQTVYVYDRGRLAALRSPQGVYTNYQYAAANEAGAGQVTRIARSVTPTGAEIDRVDIVYNAQHLPTEERAYTASAGNVVRVTKRQYAQFGLLERELKFTHSATNPTAARDLFYNAMNEVDAVADENHAPLSAPSRATANIALSYDSLGRVTEKRQRIAQGTGSTWQTERYTYDTNDNVTSVTDPEGRVTFYAYNDFGEVRSVKTPDGGERTFAYDAGGNLIEARDAMGIVTRRTFDHLRRLLSVHRDGGGTTPQSETYVYDDCHPGSLCRVVDSGGSTEFSYDTLGRVLSETRIQPDGSRTRIGYSYDALGRVASLTYPSGRTLGVAYSVTDPERVSSLSATLNGSNTVLVSDIVYDSMGALKAYTLADGSTISRTYDHSGQLEALSALPAFNRSYGRDGLGNITSITDTHPQSLSGNETFTYDTLSRLRSATGMAYGTRTWAYDKAGNRTQHTTGALTAAYAYQPQTNRLTQITGDETWSLTHNPRGDVTALTHSLPSGPHASPSPLAFAYDAAERLREITTELTPGNPASALSIQQASYDFRFRRTAKHTGQSPNDTTAYFAYGTNDALLSELVACPTAPCDVAGAAGANLRTVADYVYLGGERIAQIAVAADGSLLTESAHFYRNDHLGTPLALTDATGSIVWQTAREPFGRRINESASGNVSQPFDFPGQYLDQETGLAQNWWRTYDPATGRYLQRDPIGGGDLPYSYAQSNPLNVIDSRGRGPELAPDLLYDPDIIQAPEWANSLQLALLAPFMPAKVQQAIAFFITMQAKDDKDPHLLGALGMRAGASRAADACGTQAGAGAARGAAALGPRTVMQAVEQGLVSSGGKLNPLLTAVERGFQTAAPKSAGEAFTLIQQATRSVGLDVGHGAMGPAGELILQNAGGVTTRILSTGEIVFQRGADVLLHLIP